MLVLGILQPQRAHTVEDKVDPKRPSLRFDSTAGRHDASIDRTERVNSAVSVARDSDIRTLVHMFLQKQLDEPGGDERKIARDDKHREGVPVSPVSTVSPVSKDRESMRAVKIPPSGPHPGTLSKAIHGVPGSCKLEVSVIDWIGRIDLVSEADLEFRRRAAGLSKLPFRSSGHRLFRATLCPCPYASSFHRPELMRIPQRAVRLLFMLLFSLDANCTNKYQKRILVRCDAWFRLPPFYCCSPLPRLPPRSARSLRRRLNNLLNNLQPPSFILSRR